MAGAPRRSDVDFADVFGGPPRRSSGSDRGRRSSLDSPSGSGPASRERSGAEERPVFGDRTSSGLASRERQSGGESGPGERPVFGDRTSSERRQFGQEFYRDIFPGGEPASPRRGGSSGDRDVFGAPTSPGGSTSHLLSRSSFSMKVTRGVDSSVPTSPSRHTSNRNDDDTSYAYSVPASPNSSTNSSLAQGVSQQDSKKNPFSWHRYPFLSRFRSSGDKKDSSQRVNSMDSECEGTPISSASFISSDKFHFSFYKWAGKGALLMLPASVQEKDGNIVGVRSFPQVVVQGIDLIDEEESMSATPASKSQTDHEDYKSGKDGLFERKHSINSTTKDEAISLVFDEYMQVDKTKQAGTKHSTNSAKNNASTGSPRTQISRPPSGEKSRGSRVLKDFIKIFSPEVSPKRKAASEAQDQSSGKNGSKGGVEDKFSISGLETDEDIKTDKTNNQNAFSAAPSMSDVQGRMEKPILTVDDEILTRTGKFPGKEDIKPTSSDKSVHVETEEKVRDTSREESHMENLEECVVEHLDEDQLQDDNEKEQIKISQSKIREWSKGKEGNIRSLLSTLQYVLWPESGWKPVPLVNIIEGAAVKKAYQKALLCLHPDKLQQRGAAMHQKYIAEKVFEILQEAWKEFNSVTFG